MFNLVKFTNEETYVTDFLNIPKFLYGKRELTQNAAEELTLLTGRHVLSKYFSVHKYVAYSGTRPAGRIILTVYPGDDTAYIGFFECIDDIECSRLLFSAAEKTAADLGIKRIAGPVNCSFWIGYRLKINGFGKPYVSEPYNKPYYQKLFNDGGYLVTESYVSNIYKKPPLFNFHEKKYEERLKEFEAAGYIIRSPQRREFESSLKSIYKMLMELYKDFPIFKELGEETFLAHYSHFKHITDLSMVKLAFFNGEMVGFFIGMPDYGNMLYSGVNLLKLLKLCLMRLRARNYVMLYAGVMPEHRGLGKALTQTIIKNVQRRRSSSIGAFIQENKETADYVKGSIERTCNYVLLTKELT